MTDYSNSTIYKISCRDSNVREIYVGSSYDYTHRRDHHKSSCTNVNDAHHNTPVYKFIREHGGWDNWKMVELYKYPCENKQQLEQEERRAWDKFICYFDMLNDRKPYRSKDERQEYLKQKCKERYDENIEREREEARERYHTKKEDLNTPVKCECGLMINKQNITKHKKTKKHTDRMKALAQGIVLDNNPTDKTKKHTCECGAMVTNLNRHKKTPAHTKRMAAKTNTT